MVGVSSRVGISIIGYVGAATRRAATPTSYETLDRSRGAAGPLEQDDVTEVSLNWLRRTGHNATEETNRAIWITLNVRDIRPFEVALV